MGSSDWLAWVDLETTGLDPDQDLILEIAVVVTDGNLCVANLGPNLVIHQDLTNVEIDDYVVEMHRKSGLLSQVENGIDIRWAEERALEFLNRFDAAGRVPLAGSTVGFDRSFLRTQMPDLEEWFHYRNADISAVQEFVSRWDSVVFDHAPQANDEHRALPDILESIAKARYYREALTNVTDSFAIAS